jgi:hypothetical protein
MVRESPISPSSPHLPFHPSIISVASCLLVFLSSWLSAQTESSGKRGLVMGGVTIGATTVIGRSSLCFLKVQITNEANERKVGRVVGMTQDADGEATSVPIELNAGQVFEVELPIPLNKKNQRDSASFIVSLYGMINGREVLLEKGGRPQTDQLSVRAMPDTLIAAMAVGPDPDLAPGWRWPFVQTVPVSEFVVGAKVDAGLSRRMVSLESNRLPDGVVWDSVDCLVISDARYLENPANESMLKRWMLEGGRLWILLDEIDVELVSRLLEPQQSLSSIGQREISSGRVVVDSVFALSDADRSIPNASTPYRLKQVVATGARATHHLEDWPLALWFPNGRGKLLVTTLNAPAWVTSRGPSQEDRSDYLSNYQLLPWANSLAGDFFRPKRSEEFVPFQSDYPVKQIGNPVVAKSIVGWSLCSYLLIVGLAGWFQWRSGRATKMGWIAPALSLLGCVPLFVASYWVRNEISDSLGKLQLVELTPDGSHATVRELTAVHLRDSKSMSLQSRGESCLEPISLSNSSGIRNWNWTDYQEWSWSNNAWPSGLWRSNLRFTVPTPGWMAHGYFSESGLHFEFPNNHFCSLQDPVLCMVPGHRSRLELTDGDVWTPDRIPSAGNENWVSGAVISDEQQRRLQVYRELFSRSSLSQPLNRRVIFGFTPLWDNGPKWDSSLTTRGSALVGLPIQLHRPRPGEQVLVPHHAITVEKLLVAEDRNLVFNEETGRWPDESSLPTKSRIRFRLPTEVLPFEVSKIVVNVLATAPERTMELSWLDLDSSMQDEGTELFRVESPSSAWSHAIDAPDMLRQASKRGYVDLKVEMSPLSVGSNMNRVVSWGIEYLTISAEGKSNVPSIPTQSNLPQSP